MAESYDAYFDIDRRGGKVIVRFKQDVLAGRDDVDTLYRRLEEVVNMTPKPDVVLSFQHVKHLSSTFIGKLLALHKKVQQRKGRLVLADVNDTVREVFILTRINEHIPIAGMDKDADKIVAAANGEAPKGKLIAGAVVVAIVIAAAIYLWLR